MAISIAPGAVVAWEAESPSDRRLGVVLGELSETAKYVVASASWGIGGDQTVNIQAEDFVRRPVDEDDDLQISHLDTSTLPADSLTVVGQISGPALSRALRARITDTSRWFYETYHHPRRTEANTSAVPYSGRVFDHRELEFAVEASLDFWLTLGRFGERLQRDLARYLGVRRTVLVNSGSSANLLAVSALTSSLLGDRALRPGDEVITTACGFPTTVNPILQNDCVAVLVDTDPGSGNVDVTQLEAALTERTKAVILAHALGNPFNIDAVLDFCRRHELWLVEDTCDALGSTYRSPAGPALVGRFGDLSTLSFYPAHHITMGEGGAVNVVSDPMLVRAVESLRDWGRDCWCDSGQDNICGKRFSWQLGDLPQGYDHKFVYSHVGYNLKPTDWQAAIGCAQFEKLPEFNRLRRRNWELLREAFGRYEDLFELPYPEDGSDPSWFGFKVLPRPDAPFGRSEIVGFFESHRVQTRMIFGGNLIRQPAYWDRVRADGTPAVRTVGQMTGADRIMNSGFFIGVYPGLTEAHIERVGNVLDQFVDGLSAGAVAMPGVVDLRRAARDLSPRRQAVRDLREQTGPSRL
ncbi:LPS biosynthesis protein [Actinocatenispora thailandica]|uniref:LPS biosynthesis protein n=1 Tax=Actinocatenispora thailandica TaxID=227318 RepID=A0A7R7DLM3_9ACTN|nr:lipopolysaccharide biosynthesis protein RfbH [Actinocatenispora thailandica]BCJ33867.1 LPS biosynthesis protein [Actinocatenispora thailandica]